MKAKELIKILEKYPELKIGKDIEPIYNKDGQLENYLDDTIEYLTDAYKNNKSDIVHLIFERDVDK